MSDKIERIFSLDDSVNRWRNRALSCVLQSADFQLRAALDTEVGWRPTENTVGV